MPARVDQRTGGVLGAVNIPLHDLEFRTEMREWLGLPVTVDNDASAAALAEHRVGRGSGRERARAADARHGRRRRRRRPGAGSTARWAELGHMVIVEDGEPCQGACTGRGHVESYCSGSAVDRLAQRDARRATPTRTTWSREQAPGAGARSAGTWASAIGSVVNVFGPEVVVIGGGFGVAAFDQLVEPAREVLPARRCRRRATCRSCARSSALDAGMIGAALAARDALE